jgi:hypothetical protein
MCFLLYLFMRYFFLFFAFAAFSCKNASVESTGGGDTVTKAPSFISETRTSVNSAPAAEYSEPIKDELNDWKFSVALYETKRTFHYNVRIQSKEMRVNDTINIPNFGAQPKVEVHKGKEPLTAIIGFLDKKNAFREYREVSFKNDKLRMHTLNTYSVGVYKTKTE